MATRLTNSQIQALYTKLEPGRWVPAETLFAEAEREDALPPGELWCSRCQAAYRPARLANSAQCPGCGARVKGR